MAAATYFDTVQKIYIAFYQRPADPAGLKYWAEQIDLAGGDASAVVAAFAASAEATALYGTIDASTIGNVIDAIYMALFNRLPDAAGKQFYVDGFTAGTFTAGSIALAVLDGATGGDATAIANKAAVANEFTAQVDGRPLTDAAFGTAPFAATYAGDTDAGAARGILATVTEDAGTILTAEQVTQQIQVQIADGGDAIITFSLIASASSVSEGASVTFNVVGGQANFTYSYDLTGVDAADVTGGALTGTITTDANGKGSFTVALANDRVSDGVDTLVVTLPNTGKSASVTVNDTSTDNIAPVAVDATGATTEAGAVVTGQLVATDAENDAVTFALDAAVEGLTLNADGTYSFDPSLNTAAQALTYKDAALDVVANYTVTDALGATDTGTITITVTPKPLTFTLTADKTSAEEGATTVYTVTASEALAEAADVVFTLVPGDGVAVNAGTANTNTTDFATGAFNPKTVTIAAGATTATFDVVAVNDATTELQETYSVKAEIAGQSPLTLSGKVVDATGEGGVGQTFTLTTGIDTMPGLIGSANSAGTDGNDTIVALIDDTTGAIKTTITALDSINGGLGNDVMTLNVLNGAGIAGTAVAALPALTLSSVETVNVRSAVGLTADFSSWTGVTAINATQITADAGADALALTAGATANVNVTSKAVNDSVVVNGGKDVNVTLTDVTGVADTVTIGAGTAAKGAVTVSMTGAATVAGADATLSAVAVTGGSTVSVTQKATSDAAAAAADTVGATITQGAVNVTGNAATTTVTVKQDAAVAEVLAVSAVAAKATTQEVTFTAAAQGDTVTLDLGAGTLMFTAKKALTAAEVASAFANLASGAVQGNASATLGLYTDATGGVSDGWSSGAVQAVSATQSKVVFSNAAVAPPAITTAVFGTVTATAAGAVAGTAAVTAKTGVLGVANGAVVINDSGTGTIKTISVDGYATASTIGAGTATAVLETLTLKNAQGTASMVVADTAATLALTVEKLGTAVNTNEAVVTLTAAPVTLNVTTVGNNYIDLTAAATETLNVSGTGLLDLADVDLAALKAVKVTETAGLTLNVAVNNTVTSVDTTGTTGAVTVTIDGDKATYAGGAGVDSVTVANPGTAISKAINLGGGNDRLNLSAATPLIPTVVLDGGDGTDTLVLAAADAVSLSGAATFEAKINSFERLEVGAVGATGTVNLDNLNDINYVITNGNGGGFDLTLDKMLSGATVELKAASVVGDDTIVKLADATGTSDVVKLVTNAGSGVNVGQVTAADVETINITANDTDPALLTVSTNSLTLNANKAATVTVDGGGNLVLTLAATSTEVTLIDASTATGALTVATLAGDTAATTVKGGSAADTLTAAGANDVLQGGAGKDTLKVTTGSAVTLTGGDGIDAFDMSGYLGTVGGAATITDFAKGETIKFVANAAADFKSGKVTLITEATFTEYVNEAMKVASVNGTQAFGVSWFEFNSNTFIVQNKAADNTFDDGVDIIVKLTGAVDLSASSFNEMGQGTLLFI